MLDGSHVPSPYPGAVDLTGAHDDLGHLVLYLTGRPYWLTRKTREWLPPPPPPPRRRPPPPPPPRGRAPRACAPAPAYGNATTDISASLGVGLPAGQVWIIGANAGQQGTHA